MRSASASFSRRVALERATSMRLMFSPSMAAALAWATCMRWSRCALASPMEPSRSFSATDFLASLMALAAASRPSAVM